MKKYQYILAAMSLIFIIGLACTTSTPQSISLPEGILFQDDFEDSSSGWDQINVDDGITDYENGYYRIYVDTDSTDVWANPGLNFTDAVVEVEATKAGGPDDNDMGVICRYQDVSNFYFFIIASDGYYGVGRVIDGEQELIGMDSMLTSDAIRQGNATNKIVGECVGDNLNLIVNGQVLATVTDSTFDRGDVGLMAGTFSTPGTDIHFDNFVVREP